MDALFRQAGVIRAAPLEAKWTSPRCSRRRPEPRGRSVAVLTNAGGSGILCADACEAAGLELPRLADETVAALTAMLPAEASVENPVDMLGGATAAAYAEALPAVLAIRDRRAHRALRPDGQRHLRAVADAVARAAREPGTDKPVLAVAMSAASIRPRSASRGAAWRRSRTPSRRRGRSARPRSAPTGCGARRLSPS